ncbi:hypothetical protein [Bradyrhizobium genosp. P]|uniref:hypothetical protein n=1 Tax=Bradyrhizobium genosp. P TaxID=83641 RepID=UPI003CF287FC
MIGPMMMCVGVVVLLFGMLAGIAMGIRQDFALASAHAHLNLVGGVLLFLFGLIIGLFPPRAPHGWRSSRAASTSPGRSCSRRGLRSSP